MSHAQDGAALFDDLCSDCHSIGDGVYYGPDLMGVEQRRSATWLFSFIKSAKTLIASGDKDAVAVFEAYKKKKMPNTDASDAEIKAIIAYIKSMNKSAPKETTQETQTTDQEENQNTTGQEETTAAVSVEAGASSTPADDRIAALEAKIDKLLQYHKRSEEREITDEDLRKGRLLFTGKKEFKNGAPACVSCHNVKEIDSLNWNPSAYELATFYSNKNGSDLGELMSSPVSGKMKEVLENHELTEYEIFEIKAYLQQIAKHGLTPSKEKSNPLYWYIALAVLITISLLDLLFTQFIKPRAITLLIVLVGTVVECKAIYSEAKRVGINIGYEPEQPIKFSHRIHAGENKIACQYCHSTPEYSKISGIPYDNICLNCHNKIKKGTHSGSFEIKKIYRAIEKKEPIQWVKVHNLPDHVFYSHAQHVGPGKLACKTCHGKVEEMDRVRQVSTLSMQWCLNCHREHKVDFDNKYYTAYKELHEQLKSGKIEKVTVSDIGGEDCQKCHY
ncbi:MAG: c-type cytochrome [Flavobacteriales bacterium]